MLETVAPGQARLSGAVDVDSAAALLAPLTRLAAAGALKLDLSGLTRADSAALALLLAAARAAREAGQRLTLTGAPAGLALLGDLYALAPLFNGD